MSAERDYVQSHLDDLHADLDAWLRIPSISADPANAADVARSAEWLAEALRRTGFPTVEIWPTPGAPAVYAEWPSADAGAPVALVYGHHDVQPVDPPELWVHPPFEPTVVEGPTVPSCTPAARSTTRATSPSTCSACAPTWPPPVATPPP